MRVGDQVRLTAPSSGAHLALARLAAGRLADRLGMNENERAALHDAVGTLWDAVADGTGARRVTIAFTRTRGTLHVAATGPRGRDERSLPVKGPGGSRR